MKKLILPMLIVLLFGISIYTVTNYNKNKSKDNNTTPSAESTTEKNTASRNNTVPNESAATEDDSSTDESTAPAKTPALDFKLKDLNGKEVSLSDFKGKKVFLNFWASWCPPCKAEMPDIERVYKETKDSDLVILAINVGESRKVAKSFIESKEFNFTVLLDLDENTASKYKLSGYPTSYFIDTEGNIASSKIGYMTLEEMKAHINEL